MRGATAGGREISPADMDVDEQVTAVASDGPLAVVRMEATPGFGQETGGRGQDIDTAEYAGMLTSDQLNYFPALTVLESNLPPINVETQISASTSLQQRQCIATARQARECKVLEQRFRMLQTHLVSEMSHGGLVTWTFPTTALKELPARSQRVLAELRSNTLFGLDLATMEMCVHNYISSDPHRMTFGVDESAFPGIRIVHPIAKPDILELGALSSHTCTRLAEVIRKNIQLLLLPHVIAVLPSNVLLVGGQTIAVPCIRVLVRSKGFIPVGSWVLPYEVDDVPVDVVEGRPVELHGYPDGGASTMSGNNIFSGTRIRLLHEDTPLPHGTFGAVVRARGSGGGQLFGLTCAHVLDPKFVDSRYNVYGDIEDLQVVESDDMESILGSPIADRGCEERQFSVDCGLFGPLSGTFSFTSQLNIAGLRRAWSQAAVRHNKNRQEHRLPAEPPILAQYTGTMNDLIGQTVLMHGSSSGISVGTICSYGMAVYSAVYSADQDPPENHHLLLGGFRARCFECMFIEPRSGVEFSEHGDSGSLVFLPDGKVVGLLFAGCGRYSLASFISDVTDQLSVDIVFEGHDSDVINRCSLM